jgi:flagellar secretion chaperone FliS
MNPNYRQAALAYRTAATRVHPLVAVVRLYDEAIRLIRKGSEAAQAKKPEQSFISINRASTILRGLSHNLNFGKGEELAQELLQAYTRNILALHISFGKPDAPERYRKIAAGLGELRDAWAVVAGMKTRQEEAEAIAAAKNNPPPGSKRN